MSGSNYLLDTNIIIYALKGLESVKPYFEENCFLSVISEIEILGIEGISKKELAIRRAAVDYCSTIPLTELIKNEAIRLKQEFKIKIPDAVIAATALSKNSILITADKGFKRFKELSLILVNV